MNTRNTILLGDARELAKTPQEYVAGMVTLFRELRRALRHDATCWINLGDGIKRKDLIGRIGHTQPSLFSLSHG